MLTSESEPQDSGFTTGVPHRQIGRYLRDMRQAYGLSIRLAAKAIGRGTGTLQRLETGGATVIHDEDLAALCELYDRMDMLPVLKSLAAQGREPNWWHQYGDVVPESFNVYLGLEAAAETLRVYRTDMISGLFQALDYARALDVLFFAQDTLEDLDRRVGVRRRRQYLITRRRAPLDVELVLDEGVTRRMVGTPAIMAAQLRHLADLPANVRVRVLPDRVGFPLGIATGPFSILDFGVDGRGQEREPAVVYVESYTGDLYLERPDSVLRHRRAFDTIQAVALSVADSKQLLRQGARRYDGAR